MPTHKSNDCKLTAVQYYLVEDTNRKIKYSRTNNISFITKFKQMELVVVYYLLEKI